MKIPDILVEIIDLKLCSSLKLDGVYKKGMFWAGTRHLESYIHEREPLLYSVICMSCLCATPWKYKIQVEEPCLQSNIPRI